MNIILNTIACIKAIEDMGAKLVKASEESLYFDIPKGCELDDDERLQRAAEALRETTGLSLRVKRIK